MQSFLQQIEMLGLQIVEQMLLQQAMSLINHRFNETQAAISGPIIASAYAPAATMVSIATEGEADVQAPAMIAAALGVVQGLAFAREGLYIDRGTHSTADDVLVRVSKGEGIINAREVAARGGKSWVDSINSGVQRPRLASGAFISGGGTSRSSSQAVHIHPNDLKIEVYNFIDRDQLMRKWAKSSAGRKILNDHGRRQRW
jgi:hypothetical protein